jgi:transposase
MAEMRDVELFQMALGLESPWYVERTEFDAEGQRLDLYLDFREGGRFTCPECGAVDCPAYDTSTKTWRHLNFFQHEAYLHARVPRATCDTCGVKLVDVPWARSGSGFTLLFEAMILALVKGMPVAAVGRLVGEHDSRLWRMIHHYVEVARDEVSHASVDRVGVDETSLKRGHHYLTLFVDLEETRVLFATEGRESDTFGAFCDDLEAHGGDPDRIRELCIDMSPAYQKGAREYLPYAQTTFDRFHIVKLLNEAVDQVRRAERKDAPELTRTRYLWLKNQSNLSLRQQRQLDHLLLGRSHLRTVQAYQMKLAFQDFWHLSAAQAERFLTAWCDWVRTSDLPSMIRFAQTVETHRVGILRWFHTRISNGLLEGLSSLVQAAKARARGYRSTRNLIAMIYLMHGKLPLHQPI